MDVTIRSFISRLIGKLFPPPPPPSPPETWTIEQCRGTLDWIATSSRGREVCSRDAVYWYFENGQRLDDDTEDFLYTLTKRPETQRIFAEYRKGKQQ